MRSFIRPFAVSFALLASACATSQLSLSSAAAPASELLPGPKPAPYTARDSALVGEYDTNSGVQFIIEDGGKLFLLDTARASMKRRNWASWFSGSWSAWTRARRSRPS